MKKKYVKPAAFVEGFEVSSHIATCVFDFRNSIRPENCAADYNSDKIEEPQMSMTIFTDTTKGCETIFDANEDVCVFVGADNGFTLLHNS